MTSSGVQRRATNIYVYVRLNIIYVKQLFRLHLITNTIYLDNFYIRQYRLTLYADLSNGSCKLNITPLALANAI